METIFINTENSKTSEALRFRSNLTKKTKKILKNMALANLSIYFTWEKMKSVYNTNKFIISTPTPTWNDTFDLADGS